MSVMLRKPTHHLASITLLKAFRAFVVPTVAEKFQSYLDAIPVES